ncbi:MAG: glycosyltransferase family 4 protein, partial [Sphingobacterium sp.]|nr:glycosyltransferase family 4 protein [Sphingobacterium sp.]
MRTIVISAVNLVEAGTLTILKDCLTYLAALARDGEYRVVAVVHKKSLVDFPNIEYIETQWPKKRWVNRLWYEYVSMRSISRKIGPVYLWFSLHDTTPAVVAERRAVYCHNAFPFYRWKMHDLLFSPKIVLFALFSKYIYRPNIRHNRNIIVQQEWLRKGLYDMFGINKDKIIVTPPTKPQLITPSGGSGTDSCYSFVFAGSPNSHKNFEVICSATEILLDEGIVDFKVHLTLKGDENRYAQWINRHWGHLQAINFMGFVNRQVLEEYYRRSDCLIFPSRIESWGLPISEFAQYEKPMLLADLPYAHETAAGSKAISFFDADDAVVLAAQMKALIQGDHSILKEVKKEPLQEPFSLTWEDMFNKL